MSDPQVTVGEVIFTSFKPIAKMAGIAVGGGIFARIGILTPEVCRANAALIISLLLPLLIFSTVVPSFDPDNMSALLILIITALAYMVMGLIFGLIVRWFTPIPKTWKGGVVACGLLGNWGDLIIGYISTLAKSQPFEEKRDVSLGIAYSSIFMVVQMVVIYNLGGLQLIKRDFDRPMLDIESSSCSTLAEKNINTPASTEISTSVKCVSLPLDDLRGAGKESATSPEGDIEKIAPSFQALQPDVPDNKGASDGNLQTQPQLTLSGRIWKVLKPFCTAPSITLILSIVIANVQPLKALFVHTSKFSIPDAPDSRPPLDFIMEITGFAGPSVPVLGLILLGASFSRLSIKSLPKGFWKSVVAMACLKLVVGPIIGMVWTSQMAKHTPLVNEEDKMLKFVMIIASGTPSATAMIYLTAIFAPLEAQNGVEMSALSALLLAQYFLMLVSLTAAVSYALLNVI